MYDHIGLKVKDLAASLRFYEAALAPLGHVLGACRMWDVESENWPQRGQFLPDLQSHSRAMGQKDGEKWTAAVNLQQTLPTSDRLPGSHDDSYAGIGPPGAPALWLYAAKDAKGPGTHIAFRAAGHQAVDAFYRAGLKAGASDNGGPGPRPDYSPTYYAAFLIDPDGNNVEAVCP